MEIFNFSFFLPLLFFVAVCAQGCSREHGGCRRPGTCRCRVGWTGPNCTECVPYPGCVHGTCKRPWECRCQPGWTGDLCEEKLTYCEQHDDLCKNNGTCISMTKEDGNYRWLILSSHIVTQSLPKESLFFLLFCKIISTIFLLVANYEWIIILFIAKKNYEFQKWIMKKIMEFFFLLKKY